MIRNARHSKGTEKRCGATPGQGSAGFVMAKKRLDRRGESRALIGNGCEQPGQAKATQGVAPMSRDANEMHGAELRRQSIALLGAGGG